MDFENSFNNEITIKDIRASLPPNSPRRSSKTLTCAILNKSPIKPTRNGSMFSVNLCDNEKSSTIRAVCFSEDIYAKLESKKTYELESFKVKKSFGDKTNSELVLDHETKIKLATSQVQIENCSYTISQILGGETGDNRFLNVKAKVVSLEEPCVVGTFPETKTKRTVCVGDTTGHMELILWRERADVVCFKDGDVLGLENVVVSKFNGQLNLTTAFETSITVLDEEMEVATRSAKRPLSTSNVMYTETSILAFKEFVATYSCLACRKPINFDDFHTGSALITCPTCSCAFLKTTLQPAHKCMVLLSINNQWFTAHSKVIQYLFQWSETKLKPTEDDLLLLLNTKFLVRVDLKRKIVEHASCVDQDRVDSPDPLLDQEIEDVLDRVENGSKKQKDE